MGKRAQKWSTLEIEALTFKKKESEESLALSKVSGSAAWTGMSVTFRLTHTFRYV